MKNRKEYTGIVVSDKMMKTVVVAIDRIIQHPRYKKYLKKTSRFKAHDELNVCNVGDQVKLIETRPISAQKHLVVLEVLRRAKEV